MAKSSVTGKAFDIPLLKRVLKYVRPYKLLFGLTFLFTILTAFLSIARPLIVKYAIDHAISNPNQELLLTLVLLMLGALIFQAIMQFFQTYYANYIGQNVIKDLRVELYEHILRFKLQYFDKTPIGKLVTRSVSDIETISDVFSQGIIVMLGDFLQVIVILIAMFVIDWQLALIVLIPIPLLIVATAIFKKIVKSSFQQVRTQVAKLNAFAQEHISGMRIVQIFNREKVEMDRFKKLNKGHKAAYVRTIWAYSIFFPIVDLLSASSLALLIWWGTRGVILDYVTFGNLFAFIFFTNMLFRPIRQLADQFNTLQMGMVSSERIFEILDTDDIIKNEGTFQPETIKGEVRFKDVWFAYNEDNYVLKGLDFSVKEGDNLALVGETGAGKTSIINILSRLYEYNKGEILLDGKNIRDYDLTALRDKIAIVSQEVFLFSDTVYNNITLNSPDYTKEEVVEAAKAIGAHDFISKLPGKYDYNVHERGSMLSLGQRQLLAFIRAYVYNPDILILDEATSSIDTESEQMIQKATEVLTKDRTSIIIAHRLSTIQHADMIMVMDNGQVVESGNHNELLTKEGYYKRLYELQFKEELADSA